MIYKIFLAGLVAFVSYSVKADFIGIHAGAGVWNGDFTGDVIDGVSLENDLNFDSDMGNYFYVAFEHPLPLIPNIKLSRTNMEAEGDGVIPVDLSFGGSNFVISEPVIASMDLSHTDLTLYYEIVDIGMDIDLGVTVRNFTGDVLLNSDTVDIDVIIPMLYARAKFGLPFTGTYFGGDINYLSFSDSNLSDIKVQVGWETENFIFPEFGVEVGYRRFSVEVDESDAGVTVKTDVDGLFVNITAHF